MKPNEIKEVYVVVVEVDGFGYNTMVDFIGTSFQECNEYIKRTNLHKYFSKIQIVKHELNTQFYNIYSE